MKAPVPKAARTLPPLLTAGLVVMWLLLNESLSLGHVLLGALLAGAVASASGVLRPLRPAVRNLHLVAVLSVFALQDIVRSNVGVARIVLGLVRNREVRSGFVEVPLELKDPHGLAVLASIVTSTPGTVWVQLDVPTSTLTLHILDLKDEQEWIDWIKNRYERLLRRIFE